MVRDNHSLGIGRSGVQYCTLFLYISIVLRKFRMCKTRDNWHSFNGGNSLSRFEMGKTIYNPQWPRHYKWVTEVKNDKHFAFCVFFQKKLFLGKMGESALKSHGKCDRHKRLCDLRNTSSVQVGLQSFFSGNSQASSTVLNDNSESVDKNETKGLKC